MYLWVGRSANRLEVEKSMDLARKYNAQATDGRHPDIPIVQVKASWKPALLFTLSWPLSCPLWFQPGVGVGFGFLLLLF